MSKRFFFAARFVFLAVLVFLVASAVSADGSEELGPPSISIASGTDVVAAGTGLESQPGTIDIDVPLGATVQQVLLYWSGGAPGAGNSGDDTVTVNGGSVTGTLIGGPTLFFGNLHFSTYRADITGLGLVGPGANSLTVEDMDFGSDENNGAGVLVIFDDGSDASNIQVVDGLDLAFVNFRGLLRETVAKTFFFAPAETDRTASLAMFFGSVSSDGLRPSSIEVTTGGATTLLSNLLGSNDGPQWDTLDLDVTIPANAASLTVQAFSRDDLATGNLPASFSWIGAGLAVPPGPPPPPPPPPPPDGGEGCTPGIWKQRRLLPEWVNYSPVDDYETTFGVDASFTKTLLATLRQGGGGEKALGRHAVAGLLNADNPEVDYYYSVVDVITLVQEAYASGDYEGAKDLLEAQNEQGCPF